MNDARACKLVYVGLAQACPNCGVSPALCFYPFIVFKKTMFFDSEFGSNKINYLIVDKFLKYFANDAQERNRTIILHMEGIPAFRDRANFVDLPFHWKDTIIERCSEKLV